MIKKITLLLSLGLLLLIPSSLSLIAQAADDIWFCEYTPPESCFTAQSSHKETRKVGDNKPAHCPDGYGKQLDDYSNTTKKAHDGLQVICEKLNIKPCNISNLQTRLEKECSKKGTCYPLGEDIYEKGNEANESTDQFVTCTDEFFADGLYGICTREAVKRYAEYLKVTNTTCDEAPTLTIGGENSVKEGTAWDTSVTPSGGTIYTWKDKDSFESIPTKGENIKLKNLTLTSKDCVPDNFEGWPKAMKIKTGYQITFPAKKDNCKLTASADVDIEDKNLKTTGEKDLEITSVGYVTNNKTKDPNILSCNQLLPKYLVGANCGEELNGDASDITYWLQRFGKQITTFIAAIAVLLIAWNAFGLVVAGGDSDKIATAKKALMWVGIGLLMTVFSYVIVKTVISLTFLQ